MSIASNLGMAWITSDLSSTGAIGGMQNMSKVFSGNPEDSIFQNLITQMLMQKNITTSASGAGLNKEGQNQSGSISDLLSGLLIGGNPAESKLQTIVNELGEASETAVNAGTEGATDESGASLEMIQALMLGMSNASAITNHEKITPEKQNLMSQMNSAISEVQSAGSELRMTGNQRSILKNNHQEDSAEYIALSIDPQIVSDDTAAPSGSVKAANFHGTDVMAKMNPEQPIKAETQDSIYKSAFKISETGSKMQTVVLDRKPVEEIVVGSADEMKQETESIQQIGLENQSPIQSSGSVNETAEMTQLTQSVEKTEPYTQIRDEILTKLEQKGPSEFKMQLDPEDLGQIDIKLKINDGKLMIDILAANSKTQELLTSQVDKLISSMGLQNVKVESVQVNQQMNSQSQDSQSQGQGYAMNFGMDFSQRKQQEHFQQEFSKGSSFVRTNSQQNETQTVELTTRTEPLRYDSHRMNYAV